MFTFVCGINVGIGLSAVATSATVWHLWPDAPVNLGATLAIGALQMAIGIVGVAGRPA